MNHNNKPQLPYGVVSIVSTKAAIPAIPAARAMTMETHMIEAFSTLAGVVAESCGPSFTGPRVSHLNLPWHARFFFLSPPCTV